MKNILVAALVLTTGCGDSKPAADAGGKPAAAAGAKEGGGPGTNVPADDRDAWVETLVRLLTDEPWAEAMRAKIRRFAETTSWANVGKLHLDVYAKLLERT